MICTLSFAEAWTKADAVTGWLTEGEGKARFEAALRTPEDGVIVEVGSFVGRSLTLLAETGRRIIAIDPLEIGMSIAKNVINNDTATALQSVVDNYPNVTWIRQRSTAAPVPDRIDMLYVDGRHKYPSPLEDFRALQPGLRQGSLVAFHDYGREFGVTKSVDELIAADVIEWLSKAGTMVVGRYK